MGPTGDFAQGFIKITPKLLSDRREKNSSRLVLALSAISRKQTLDSVEVYLKKNPILRQLGL